MTARVTLAQACKIAEVKPGTIRSLDGRELTEPDDVVT